MSKEEIQEYLKRVDALEEKLVGEDKDTLQWLIFGYNMCAKMLNEKENIIKEVREYIEDNSQMTDLRIHGIENVLSFRGSVEKLLEILDKENNNGK